MTPDNVDGPPRQSPESALAPLPPIHPSFIQVAKPYIFEQTIQDCIAAMGVNPLREESLRLQGVAWVDNVRRALHLYVAGEFCRALLTCQADSHVQHRRGVLPQVPVGSPGQRI